MNGLSDSSVVRALVQAAKDGVHVDLICRGICTLRPGVPAVSERVRVISVVGRFLEHSRVYRFDNAGAPQYFIGSADMRPRNLSRRVELLVPVHDELHHQTLSDILDLYVNDSTGWELLPSGDYIQRSVGAPRAQEALMRMSDERQAFGRTRDHRPA
jgi:polyphosphate kinase